MSVIYVMLPVALILAGCAVSAFIWATRGGQFDDVDTPQLRMLFEDGAPRKAERESLRNKR